MKMKKLAHWLIVTTCISFPISISTLPTQAAPSTIQVYNNTRETQHIWLTHDSCKEVVKVTYPKGTYVTDDAIHQFPNCGDVELGAFQSVEFDIDSDTSMPILLFKEEIKKNKTKKIRFMGRIVKPGKKYNLSYIMDNALEITRNDV